tara:strand:- start:37 stop:1017 length:981 start_codon:yes stop_codon:yes gene_type:complete
MIIAEIGSVHDGDLKLALRLVREAAKCDVNIVKFQMHIAEEETLKNAPSPGYFNKEKRFEYFKRTAFKFDEWKKIKQECKKNKVEFLCSPFSMKAVDILEKLKVKKYKIPSGELTNLPLLKKIKKTKKEVILSTGMSNWKEINKAYSIFKNKKKLTLMQCASLYPCPIESSGINVIKEMKKKFKCRIGYSDHTLGLSAACYAASEGAEVIEKHFTLSKKLYGSDAKNSMEPNEFKSLVKIINEIWKIKKFNIDKNNLKPFKKMKKIFEKSIVAKKDIKRGTFLSNLNLDYKKPGDGIRADNLIKVLGKRAKFNIKKDTKIKLTHLV